MLTLQALTCFEGNYDKTVGLFGAVRRRLSNSTVTEWAPMKAVKQQTTLQSCDHGHASMADYIYISSHFVVSPQSDYIYIYIYIYIYNIYIYKR